MSKSAGGSLCFGRYVSWETLFIPCRLHSYEDLRGCASPTYF